MGATGSIVVGAPNTLLATAEGAAAIMLQSFFRMLHAQKVLRLMQKKKEEQKRKNKKIILHPRNNQLNDKISCTVDRLSAVVDSAIYIDRMTPFLHPTSEEAQEELERVLNFQPGYTLNIMDKDDRNPRKLKSTLLNALKSGVPLILSLDGKKDESTIANASLDAEEDNEVSLRNLCSPFHFPVELIEDPLSIFDRNVFGPLLGLSSRNKRYCKILAVEENASDNQIKKAYHKKVREVHPDKGGDAEEFLKVQTAYSVLIGTEECKEEDKDFSPNKHFKLLLVSRNLQSPSPDIEDFCKSIWLSKSKDLRKNHYKVEVVLPPDVSGMSYYFAKMAMIEYAARVANVRKRNERISKSLDDLQEIFTIRKIVEIRLQFKYHDLRSRLFKAAKIFKSPILPDHHDVKFVEENLFEQWKTLDLRRRLFQAQVKLWDEKLRALDREEHKLKKILESSYVNKEETDKMDQACSKKEGRLKSRLEKMVTLETEFENSTDVDERKKLEAMIKDKKERNLAFQKFVEDMRTEIETRKREHDYASSNYITGVNQVKRKREKMKVDMLEHAKSFFDQTKRYDSEMKKKQKKEIRSIIRKENAQNERLTSHSGFDSLFRAAMISQIDNVNPKLCQAALDGKLKEVKSLILQGFNIESYDVRGYSVLSEAACTGRVEIVSLLLRLGADPNTYGVQKEANGEQKRTPLSRAANMLHVEIVKLLLDNGAYAEPAILLIRHNSKEIRKLLHDYPRERTENILVERKQKMQELCSIHMKKWSIEDRRKFYQQQLSSKLILCAKNGNIDEIIRLLEEHAQREADENPDLILPTVTANNVKDNNGRTILAIACWKGHYKCVERLLIEWKRDSSHLSQNCRALRQKIFKVDVNTRFRFNNCWGWTPLSISIYMNYPDICSLLRSCGGNPLIGTEFHKDAFELVQQSSVNMALKEFELHTKIRKVPMIEDLSKERYLLLENANASKSEMGLFEKTFRRKHHLDIEEDPEEEEDKVALKAAILKDEKFKEKKKALNEQRRMSSESSFHSLQLGLGYERFNAIVRFAPNNLIKDV